MAFERGIQWSRDPYKLAEDYANLAKRFDDRLLNVMQRLAGDAEEYMQRNAPWTDRTGNARRGLEVKIERTDKNINLTFKGGDNVPYQVFLELANSGRWAIIRPAIELYMPETLRRLEGILDTL